MIVNRSVHAMVGIVINTNLGDQIFLKYGRRIGLAGNLYFFIYILFTNIN